MVFCGKVAMLTNPAHVLSRLLVTHDNDGAPRCAPGPTDTRPAMSRDDSHNDDDDSALFRRAIGDVRPLAHDRVPPWKEKPAPRPRQRELDEAQVVEDMLRDPTDPAELETGEELFFTRTGLQGNLIRRLRRGQMPIEAELDLHGKTSDEARVLLAGFLPACRKRGLRVVRVIHGKGLGSHNKLPVLKGKVNYWLQQRDEVLAFCSARPVDGGTGAVYVLLKKQGRVASSE